MSSQECYDRIILSERLKTLQHWPYTKDGGAECTAEQMAAAGFYCPDSDKDPETVKCFMCQKELDGWEPMDKPMEEHRSHSPGCEFVQLDFKDWKDMTLKEYYGIYRAVSALNMIQCIIFDGYGPCRCTQDMWKMKIVDSYNMQLAKQKVELQDHLDSGGK